LCRQRGGRQRSGAEHDKQQSGEHTRARASAMPQAREERSVFSCAASYELRARLTGFVAIAR
jgi:hypothetical protein